MDAGLNKPEAIDPGGARKLLYLIDSLRATPAGNLIYRQAAGMLDDITSSHLRSEMAYACLLYTSPSPRDFSCNLV